LDLDKEVEVWVGWLRIEGRKQKTTNPYKMSEFSFLLCPMLAAEMLL
jgi:hypothetical protein